MVISEKIIKEAVVELIQRAETSLPLDVEKKLQEAYKIEKNQLAKIQLELILRNIKLAREASLPICQDTGLLSFYVKVNSKKFAFPQIKKAIKLAVKISTEKIPLRENTVAPLSRQNAGKNLGQLMPLVHWQFSNNDHLEITVLPKGAGSENMTAFKMLKPLSGSDGIKKFVLQKVKEAGGQPCPPIILGLGIGGSADQAMELAKSALLSPLTSKSKDKKIAQLEREILKEVNKLGIGVMGLGGSTTCLGVRIELAATHTASLPIALAFGCWATRRATLIISLNGKVKFQ